MTRGTPPDFTAVKYEGKVQHIEIFTDGGFAERGKIRIMLKASEAVFDSRTAVTKGGTQ